MQRSLTGRAVAWGGPTRPRWFSLRSLWYSARLPGFPIPIKSLRSHRRHYHEARIASPLTIVFRRSHYPIRRPAILPCGHWTSAQAAVELKFRYATRMLARQLMSRDWRTAFVDQAGFDEGRADESKPSARASIRLPPFQCSCPLDGGIAKMFRKFFTDR
jgi:hypothetical protein